MDIIDIEIFLLIADSYSISKISEVLNFSQSTISYRLNSLEKEIGVPLVNRNRGRKINDLTPYGEKFIPIAEKFRTLYNDSQILKLHPVNILTIGAVDSMGASAVISDICNSVLEGESSLRLNILTRYSKEIYELVEKNIADIGFVSIPLDMKNIVTKLLFKEKYYVVRYSENPTVPRKIEPSELDPHFEIYKSWGNDYDQWHENIWGNLNCYYVCIDSLVLLQQFLTDERYWSIVPSSLAKQLLLNFRNLQIDELLLSNEYYKEYYVIKNRNPKKSSLQSLHIFKKVIENCTVDIYKIKSD